MRKIAVITGTRAEYGLLKPLIKNIDKSSDLELQLIATGMHLSPEFGLTISEIKSDGFIIKKEVETLLSSDSAIAISKSMGLGMISFSELFNELKPDLILILGDRYEILSVACAAMIANIPIAHIHGGETTEGAIDESIRHSITKMSHLHFVAAEAYKKRVIQLGENPKSVFNVGSLGIENIKNTKLMNKNELEKSLNFKLAKRNLLITFHPITLDPESSINQMENLLEAISKLPETNFIFTHPNADTNGRKIIELINNFCKDKSNSKSFTSLGQKKYFSCIKQVDGVIGNSSSGLIEVPTFKKGTINIGDRQRGRLKAKSVIDCKAEISEIIAAINKLYSNEFQSILSKVKNPYGVGSSSKDIVKYLEKFNLGNILKKTFYNIDF